MTFIAVLLVDPVPRDVRHCITIEVEGENDNTDSALIYAECHAELCPALPMLHGIERLQGKSSIFDDLTISDGAEDYKQRFLTNSPTSATFWCRRLLLARTAASMHKSLLETISLAATSAVGLDEIAQFSYDTFEKSAWTTKWTGEKFTRLWEQRENLELMRFKLDQSTRTIQYLMIEADKEDFSRETSQPKGFRETLEQEQEDLREWRELERLGQYMFQIITRTTDSYLQTVQTAEAQMSNRQARRHVSSPLLGLRTVSSCILQRWPFDKPCNILCAFQRCGCNIVSLFPLAILYKMY